MRKNTIIEEEIIQPPMDEWVFLHIYLKNNSMHHKRFNLADRRCLYLVTDDHEKYAYILSNGGFIGDNIWEDKERYSTGCSGFDKVFNKAKEVYEKSNPIWRNICKLRHCGSYKFSLETTNLLLAEILNIIKENKISK